MNMFYKSFYKTVDKLRMIIYNNNNNNHY